MDARQEIKSLKKALRVLKVMNEKGDATVSDIAAAIGVPRTTAYRLLETFAAEGYIERQPHSLYYRLTSKVLQLGADVQDSNLLIEIARPFADLGAGLGRPVSLAIPCTAEIAAGANTSHDPSSPRDRASNAIAAPMPSAAAGPRPAFRAELERETVIGMARASGDPLQSLVHQK